MLKICYLHCILFFVPLLFPLLSRNWYFRSLSRWKNQIRSLDMYNIEGIAQTEGEREIETERERGRGIEWERGREREKEEKIFSRKALNRPKDRRTLRASRRLLYSRSTKGWVEFDDSTFYWEGKCEGKLSSSLAGRVQTRQIFRWINFRFRTID